MKPQKKELNEIEGITESLSNETTTGRPSGISRIIKPTLITVLAALCLVGGIVLHKMHTLEQTSKPLKSPVIATKKLNILSQPSSFQSQNNSIDLSVQSTPFINPVRIQSQSANEVVPKQENIDTQTNEPITNELSLNSPSSTTQEEPQQQTQMDGFTLLDALQFKEHFLTETSCYEDYQKLLNASYKSIFATDVLNNLSPYCLSHQSAVENVKNAFLKNKKKAIIAYYKENNPNWIAYLKAIPATLIEIRKINPIDDTPKDILHRAQNEIYKQNISQAVDYVTKLPLLMQQKMTDFYREAAIYNRAKNSIDQLILSFENKGE